LDSMMYLIRLVHALISLLPVWFGYTYIYAATKNKNYALIGGLILAAHFLMPYLSVRNLIEKVSEAFLVPAVYVAYRGTREDNVKYLLLSGILCGLSWMVRFNVAAAVVLMPAAIWYLTRSVRPVLYFCFGALLMLVFSGSLDVVYLGWFGGSSFNILHSFIFPLGDPPLPQPVWTFAILILGVLFPPFSLFFLLTFFKRHVIREHFILFTTTASFFVVHSLITHKEERFIIPVFSLFIIMGTIGLWTWFSSDRKNGLMLKVFKGSVALAAVLNLVLLPVFMFNYAHKGMVEPFAYLSRQGDVRAVMIDRTERYRLLPIAYAGLKRPPLDTVNAWSDLANRRAGAPGLDEINYAVVYSDDRVEEHRDSLTAYLGQLEPVFHSTPSTLDRLLHFLNPRHNHTNEAWVFRRMNPE
ncbi:MAG: glycosyltransferase family 39 protein, partial [Candidatus Zixiibacteriota bacterium]